VVVVIGVELNFPHLILFS